MLKLKTIFALLFCFLQIAAKLAADDEKFANVNGIQICYQTFGDKNNPAFLLISGEEGQMILWPEKFCTLLADNGFYVIRYDQRDSGLSSAVDFEKKPYTLQDLAEDAHGLVDQLGLKKVNLFGMGMGGSVAELFAAKYPDQVALLAMMGSEFDLKPYDLAVQGLPEELTLLSAPKEEFVEKIKKINAMAANTTDEKVKRLLQKWNLLNGSPLDEKEARPLAQEYVKRDLHPENLQNYQKAMRLSEGEVQAAHSKIGVPTIIFLGSDDPVLGYDHVEAFANAIPQASCYYIQGGVGHFINKNAAEFLVEQFLDIHKRVEKSVFSSPKPPSLNRTK